jgi:hypothetical protein
VFYSPPPPSSYLCTQASFGGVGTEDKDAKENEEAAPVYLHTHSHARAHAERAVTTARVTHSFTSVRIALHSCICFSSIQVPEVKLEVEAQAAEKLKLEVEAQAAEKFICKYCKNENDRKYSCNACRSKFNVLTKMFTNWPIEAFEALPEDAQVNFWRSGSRSKQQMQIDLTVSITSLRVEQEVKRKTGKFLPESVWKAQGYKTDKITTNCEKKWCEQLEENTYMLLVYEVVEEKVRQDVVTMLEGKRDKGLRGKLSHFCSPSPSKPKKKTEKKDKKKRGRDSSSSSSSSGSSSSSNESKKAACKTPPRSAKETRKDLAQKIKDANERAKVEAKQKQLLAKEQAAKAKQLSRQVMAEEAKLKKIAENKAKQERRMACMYLLQNHAVTTACSCCHARPILCA